MEKIGYVIRKSGTNLYYAGSTPAEISLTELPAAFVFDNILEADRFISYLRIEGLSASLEPRTVPTLPDDLKYFGERLIQHPDFVTERQFEKPTGYYSK